MLPWLRRSYLPRPRHQGRGAVLVVTGPSALAVRQAGPALTCRRCRLLEAQHTLVGRPIWVFWLAENRWFRGKPRQFRVLASSQSFEKSNGAHDVHGTRCLGWVGPSHA